MFSRLWLLRPILAPNDCDEDESKRRVSKAIGQERKKREGRKRTEKRLLCFVDGDGLIDPASERLSLSEAARRDGEERKDGVAVNCKQSKEHQYRGGERKAEKGRTSNVASKFPPPSARLTCAVCCVGPTYCQIDGTLALATCLWLENAL